MTKSRVIRNITSSKSKTKRSTIKRGKKRQSSSPLYRLLKKSFWAIVAILATIFSFFCIKLLVDNAFIIRAKFGEIIYPDGEVRGIDISHYQDNINWDQLRNAEVNGVPIRFIFVKATEGASIIDENFNENFYNAHKNGFIRGAYHFYTPGSDPIRQAMHFCKIVQLDDDDIVPILDIEKQGDQTPEQLRKNVIKWMNFVERHYGATPILYTSYKFKKDILNTPEFEKYPFWIAHYYVDKLSYKGNWKFWQHTDIGKIDGIEGHVDINVFNGKYEELLDLTVSKSEERNSEE